MTERKTALVLAGPSGGGKTTVMNELVKKTGSRFELVRSATTRERRGDGNDGEYIYLSKQEFVERCQRGEMLEFTEYGTNLYGTPYSEIQRINDCGKIPIMILDLVGVKSIRSKELDFDIYAVYVYASVEELSMRLAKRYSDSGGENSEHYKTRMINNHADFSGVREWCGLFNIAVESVSVESAASEVLNGYKTEKKDFSVEPFVEMANDQSFEKILKKA